MPIKTQGVPDSLRTRIPAPPQAKGPPDLKRPEINVEVRDSTDEAGLNKMERDWLAELKRRGYLKIRVQAITFKLGHDTRYTPDFSAIVDGRQVFFETKGYMRDDARVKLFNAAREFREYDFVKVTREKGVWTEQEVKP
jgi:hypothetical protein